jgi:PPK2 family polyphosphate:nucleotide phosphotransferase
MDYRKRFRVKPGGKFKLSDHDAGFTDKLESQEEAQAELDHYQHRLRELQEQLWVGKRYSLLVVLQALDTGGKDGTINHVLGAMNPQGCRVAAFRQPTAEERAHDFLWRAHKAAPQDGEVVIFNRSHYEDVLVVRVHDLVPKHVWSRRYKRINSFETELVEHDTLVLKFFLHISKAEQLKRQKARLDDPAKHWKLSEGDYQERDYWDDYTEAYHDALKKCSTGHAPWYVIPADHKWFRNLAVARIVVDHLDALKLDYPKATADLKRIRALYKKAAKRGS